MVIINEKMIKNYKNWYEKFLFFLWGIKGKLEFLLKLYYIY